MAIPASGAVSLTTIQTEYGGSNPISLNEYYRGGANVPNSTSTASIPTSGAISVANFQGTSKTLNAEMLIIAGAGGGGKSGDDGGGGGGAGGLLQYSGQTITPGTYVIVVGAGGGTNTRGNDTTGFSYTAVSGGNRVAGGAAGSGGGGNSTNYPSGQASTSPSQGNNGGDAPYGAYSAGGGGGGAGGAGGTAQDAGFSGRGGLGGIGLNYSITGTSVGYAGGGNASSGADLGSTWTPQTTGYGNGAGGYRNVNGGNGTANTGGGGGGGTVGGSAGSGGSGVFIIAYTGSVAMATGGTIDTTSRAGYVLHIFNSSGSFVF